MESSEGVGRKRQKKSSARMQNTERRATIEPEERRREKEKEPCFSKKYKTGEGSSNYSLRIRSKNMHITDELLGISSNTGNHENSSYGCVDSVNVTPGRPRKKKQNTENPHNENISSEDLLNCSRSKKSRKKSVIKSMIPETSSAAESSSSAAATALSVQLCDLQTTRKTMPPSNGLKRIGNIKKQLGQNDHLDGQNSDIAEKLSRNMLRRLPSKFGMFSNSKFSLENKFGLSSGHPVASTPSCQNNNLLNLLNQNSFGMRAGVLGRKFVTRVLADRISDFHLVRTASPFDRRCTAMAWHPFNPKLVGVGSKGGDIILLDIENSNHDGFVPGCGLGGVVQSMKFLPETTTSLRLLTASMDGTVILRDLTTQSIVTTYVDTLHLIHQFWYCSCDVGPRCDMIVHGDSLGNTVLQTLDGEKIWSHRLHRTKVNHTEFHHKQEWLLCTASTDQYVCLWDIRMLKNHDGYLVRLKHEKGVNSAYFSRTDGTRLLTTDQHHELRVYECGSWNLQQTVVHPHRFFQHLTPMKAAWHPLEDIVLCGRYPDKTLPGFISKDYRGIDIIDPFSTETICHLHDPCANGIVTLAQFNNIGSTLVATMGYTILVWQKDNTSDKETQGQTAEGKMDHKPLDDFLPTFQITPKSRNKTKKHQETKKTKDLD